MDIDKSEILQKLCYTGLVYGRINKKLRSKFSKSEIETLILKLIEETSEPFFEQKARTCILPTVSKISG